MNKSNINSLLIKFLEKTANAKELDELEIWIQDATNESVFKDFVKTHYAITLATNNPDSSDIRKQLLLTIKREKHFLYRNRLRSVLKYAAVVALLIGVGYYFQNTFFAKKTNDLIVQKEEVITLELDNGNIQMISEDG